MPDLDIALKLNSKHKCALVLRSAMVSIVEDINHVY